MIFSNISNIRMRTRVKKVFGSFYYVFLKRSQRDFVEEKQFVFLKLSPVCIDCPESQEIFVIKVQKLAKAVGAKLKLVPPYPYAKAVFEFPSLGKAKAFRSVLDNKNL